MANLYNVPLENGVQLTLQNALLTAETSTITFTSVVTSKLQASASIPGILVIDRVDVNGTETPTKTEYISFTGVTGSTVTGLTRGLAGTSAQDHSAGAIVEFVPDVVWADSINDVFTTQHNADGTHKTLSAISLASTTLQDTVIIGASLASVNISNFTLGGGGLASINITNSSLDNFTFNSNNVALTSNVSGYVNNIVIKNSLTSTMPLIQATGTDTNIDLDLRGQGDGVIRFPVIRQNDTSNEYINSQIMQTGWGYIANSANSFITETVTFGKSFATLPIVIISCGGDSSSGTTLGSGGNNVTTRINTKVANVSTTQFSVFFHKGDGTNFVTPGNTFYHWIAVGTV